MQALLFWLYSDFYHQPLSGATIYPPECMYVFKVDIFFKYKKNKQPYLV